MHLRLKNQQLNSEGPGASEILISENTELHVKVEKLSGEVNELNAEVMKLSKKLLDTHAVENARIEMLIKSLSPKPPSFESYYLYSLTKSYVSSTPCYHVAFKDNYFF